MITIDHHTFMIENYCSVLFLTDHKIIIQLKQQTLEIEGLNFMIDYYSNCEIRGKGIIKELRFNPNN